MFFGLEGHTWGVSEPHWFLEGTHYTTQLFSEVIIPNNLHTIFWGNGEFSLKMNSLIWENWWALDNLRRRNNYQYCKLWRLNRHQHLNDSDRKYIFIKFLHSISYIFYIFIVDCWNLKKWFHIIFSETIFYRSLKVFSELPFSKLCPADRGKFVAAH